MNELRAASACAALVLTLANTAGAQGGPSGSPPPPAAAPAPAPAGVSAPVETLEAQARPLDARSAVGHALVSNPTYAGTRLGVSQAGQAVLAEEGRYPFVFEANAGFTRTGFREGGSVRTYDVGSGVRRTFPFGTTAEVRLEAQRFENDPGVAASGTTGLGSGYGTTARASVSQPLLRGAGTSIGEAGLRQARESRKLSERTARRVQSELVRDVLLAYWELWYAEESLRIERAALALAREQEAQAIAQQRSGALAPADVLTFSTRVAALEETLVTTRLARRQRSRELNRLMGVSADSAPELSASDAPVPGQLPTAAEVEAALRSGSVELAELEAQIRLARTRAEVAGDTSRPRLDLEGFLETHGEDAQVVDAARQAGQFGWVTVHVGATFELPLDGTQRRAEKESALLAVRIAESNLKATRDRLAADAVNALAQAQAAEERLALSARTVEVAEKAHEAARGRFELGGGIALQVQQAEEDLRRARLSLARMRVEQVESQIALRHLAGLLVTDYTNG